MVSIWVCACAFHFPLRHDAETPRRSESCECGLLCFNFHKSTVCLTLYLSSWKTVHHLCQQSAEAVAQLVHSSQGAGEMFRRCHYRSRAGWPCFPPQRWQLFMPTGGGPLLKKQSIYIAQRQSKKVATKIRHPFSLLVYNDKQYISRNQLPRLEGLFLIAVLIFTHKFVSEFKSFQDKF